MFDVLDTCATNFIENTDILIALGSTSAVNKGLN